MTDGWEELRSRSHLIPIIVPDLFSVDECARILQLCEGHELQPGRIWCGESYGVDRSRRDLSTAYIPRADDTEWIYDRMDRAFFDAAAAWGFDVRRTREDLKYMVYQPGRISRSGTSTSARTTRICASSACQSSSTAPPSMTAATFSYFRPWTSTLPGRPVVRGPRSCSRLIATIASPR